MAEEYGRISGGAIVVGRRLGCFSWILPGGSGWLGGMLSQHDMTDAEWAMLQRLLPDRTPRRGPPVGRSPARGQEGVLADADGLAVAGSAAVRWALEDRLQPASALVRERDVGTRSWMRCTGAAVASRRRHSQLRWTRRSDGRISTLPVP